MRLVSTLWALLFGPRRLFGRFRIQFSLRLQLLGACRVGLQHGALGMDTTLGIGSFATHWANIAIGLSRGGGRFILAHISRYFSFDEQRGSKMNEHPSSPNRATKKRFVESHDVDCIWLIAFERRSRIACD